MSQSNLTGIQFNCRSINNKLSEIKLKLYTKNLVILLSVRLGFQMPSLSLPSMAIRQYGNIDLTEMEGDSELLSKEKSNTKLSHWYPLQTEFWKYNPL